MKWGFGRGQDRSASLKSSKRATGGLLSSRGLSTRRRNKSESESSVLSEEELQEKYEGLEWVQLARKMSRQMKLKQRDVHGVSVENTFLGIDMVAHLVERKICDSQQEALYVAQQVLHNGLIYRVDDVECDRFKCTFQPYAFTPQIS
eukprot:CAMPEP_0185851518 /NCGR_PEP_ID=MMETSP1354-20130828/10162_1 /TAXON_ID=708628 /ORGANISM="Erythrolobus madagascarensis, Strain CCMP3276" /LENGTH=146 /DNA_ID=CAMNT_0028552519 /DNA_START=56 /DNA_END=493 /DNA_ORIENTATION=-